MRFLANMGISPTTVAFLRALGHEAKHLHEEGLDRLPDEEIMAKALAEGAVLLTTDLDFGELAIKSNAQLPSVVILRLQPPMKAEKVNTYLVRVLHEHSLDLEESALLSVSEKWIRVRRLPL